MKILVFLNSYLPGFKSGGPVRTIENMTKSLHEHNFYVVTNDRDLGDENAYEDIVVENWTKLGDSNLYYVSAKNSMLKYAIDFYKVIKKTEFDVLYLQSFFNVRFTMIPLIILRLLYGYKKPVIIAPRGEFSKGAISLKAWKKRPYVFLIKWSGILRNVTWQASSEAEQKDVLRVLSENTNVFKADNIFIAPDIGVIKNSKEARKFSSEFKVIFVSRIAKMKNLGFLLDCLSKVKVKLTLNIYGPLEDATYWSECSQKIRDLPEHIAVKYWGGVQHSQISKLFSEHDIFVLPTLGENFGHVIIESLASGTPVLISDRTPWRADEDGACNVFSLDEPEKFIETIEKFSKHSTEEKEILATKSMILARKLSGVEDAIHKNNGLFKFARK